MKPVAVLLIAASAAHADTPKLPRTATAWCEDNATETFTINKDKSWTPTDQLTEPNPPQYTVAWRGKLDGDKRVDVILNEGECGTQECLHSAYVACPDGTYARVLSAEYAARVRVRGKSSGWGIIELEHVGELEKGRRPRAWKRLKLGPTGYGS